MHGRGNHIGCLNGSITRVSGELSGSVLSYGMNFEGSVNSPYGRLSGSVSIVCSTNKESFIRFKENMLMWYGADNNEGIIKYNTLVASGAWSLEEVEIEELL